MHEYHSKHGVEHCSRMRNSAECAACGRLAFHRCTTCGVALHCIGAREGHSGDCHAKWHDPVFFGKLYADALGRRKRKRNEEKPTWSEPTADTIRAAVARIEKLIGEQFADDLRHAQMQADDGDE